MGKSYKPITSMKEVPEQLRKLRRQYLRYQQAEIIYSISHKKLLELASDAGAIYRIEGTVLINKDTYKALETVFTNPLLRVFFAEMKYSLTNSKFQRAFGRYFRRKIYFFY